MRNEIAVLKRVSKGHPNIVTLHDYFEVRLIPHPSPALGRRAHDVVASHYRPRITCTSYSTFAPVASCSTGYAPRATTTRRKSSLCDKQIQSVSDARSRPSDAADLVRTIMKAVKYIHDCGIVHRGALQSFLLPIPSSN